MAIENNNLNSKEYVKVNIINGLYYRCAFTIGFFDLALLIVCILSAIFIKDVIAIIIAAIIAFILLIIPVILFLVIKNDQPNHLILKGTSVELVYWKKEKRIINNVKKISKHKRDFWFLTVWFDLGFNKNMDVIYNENGKEKTESVGYITNKEFKKIEKLYDIMY